jgi:hypothetical protein
LAGTLAINALFPGLGLLGSALIGGTGGGILGGLLGGILGPKEEQKVVIDRLEAIEFNTREQISVIEQSTDKLTKRESGIFGLPTSFNIPAYTPQFGTGGSGDVYQVRLGDITIGTGNGITPKDVKKVIEDAVADAIDNGRRTKGKGLNRLG